MAVVLQIGVSGGAKLLLSIMEPASAARAKRNDVRSDGAPDPKQTIRALLANSDRRRDAAAVVLLALVVSVFHWRGLIPGFTFLAVDIAHNQLPWVLNGDWPIHNWLLSDPIWQSYPFLAHSLGPDGSSLWNPDIYLGHPRFADPLTQSYYPVFRILGGVFGAARGFALSLWLHVMWAAVCMYGFLRTSDRSRRAAIAGALTYALSGYLITWLEYSNLIGTLVWLPAVLWTYELAVKRRDWRYAVLSAFSLAIAILNGQFQFAGAFIILLGLNALGHTFGVFQIDRNQRSFLPLAQFIFITGAGMAVASFLLLPFVSYLGETNRAGVTGFDRSLRPGQLLTLLVPDYFGNPTETFNYRGAVNYNEDTIYAGSVALLLACAAPFQTRRRDTWLAAGAALLIVYFTLGGPGVRAAGTLPFMGYISLTRSAFLLPIVLGILAAHWLDEPHTAVTPLAATAIIAASIIIGAVATDTAQVHTEFAIVRPAILTSLSLIAAVIVLVVLRKQWSEHRQTVDWMIIGLLFLDLFLWGSRYNPTGRVNELYPSTPSIVQLQEMTPAGRVAAVQIGDYPLFGPNILPLFGFSEPGGYSSIAPERLSELVEVGDPKENALGIGAYLKNNGNIVFFNQPSTRLLDVLHVTHLVSPRSLALANESMEYESLSCMKESGVIEGSTVLTDTFPVYDSAINRLDVQFVRGRDLAPQDDLIIRMWRLGKERTLMLEEELDPSSLAGQERVTFYFAPESGAPGHRYEVAFLAAGGGDTATRLCMDDDGRPSLAVGGLDWYEVPAGEFYIYERAAPMPRAYVAYSATPVAGDIEAVYKLLDESFDVRNGVVINASEAPVLQMGQPANDHPTASPADVTEDTPDRLVVHARAEQPGVLVLSERYHDGWRASIDGVRADVFPVNFVYRGVALEPGEHEVVFEFQPRSLRIGLGISASALVMCLIILGWEYRRRRVNSR
ncbi:MAG: YfhO family protein [Caldilineaceae bacterium]